MTKQKKYDAVLFIRLGEGSTTVRVEEEMFDRINDKSAELGVSTALYTEHVLWSEAKRWDVEIGPAESPSLFAFRKAASIAGDSVSGFCRAAFRHALQGNRLDSDS